MPFTHRHQALAHIGASRYPHAQAFARILMHKAPIGAHEKAQFRFTHDVQCEEFALARRVADLAGRRLHLPGNAFEQRCLARARFTHNRQNLAGPQVKRCADAANPRPILLGQVLNRKQRGHAALWRLAQ